MVMSAVCLILAWPRRCCTDTSPWAPIQVYQTTGSQRQRYCWLAPKSVNDVLLSDTQSVDIIQHYGDVQNKPARKAKTVIAYTQLILKCVKSYCYWVSGWVQPCLSPINCRSQQGDTGAPYPPV